MPYALEILTSGRGSGGRIDSPFYVDHVHPILVSSVERAVVSLLFKSQDWTPVERLYHNKGQVFEWRIKLTSGDVVPVFFDISQVNDLAPVSDAVRQEFNQRSHTVPVPDATLISRFPLIKVEARSAAEAADFISDHLERAVRQGWQVENAMVMADGWRNDYDLTRGSEKTKMSFDMRSCLVLNRADLTILTLMAGKRRGETFVQQQARMLVESGEARCAPPGSSLAAAVETEKTAWRWAKFIVTIMVVSMPVASAVVYHFTDSALFAIVAAFLVPIIIFFKAPTEPPRSRRRGSSPSR